MNQPTSRFRPHPAMLWIYAALLALLAASIGLSLLPGIGGLRLAMHMLLAVGMAALIAVIFMDLRNAGPLLRVFALGGLLWLAFMMLLFPVDYLTR